MNKMDLSVYERVSISVYAYMVDLCMLVYVCMYVRARLGTDDWRLATDDWWLVTVGWQWCDVDGCESSGDGVEVVRCVIEEKNKKKCQGGRQVRKE